MNSEPKFTWTDEAIATLRRMVGEKASSREIALAIGAPSRNSVIAKAHRLGIPLALAKGCTPGQGGNRWGSVAPSAQTSRLAVARCDAKRRKPSVTLATSKNLPFGATVSLANGPCEAATERSANAVERPTSERQAVRLGPEDRGVTAGETATYPHVPILDRKLGQCAFPLWSMERLPVDQKFCCAAPIERGSYCGEHAKCCYGGWTEEERKPFVERRAAA